MSDEKVIRHCAPTLASIKTGNLFTCAFESYESMLESLRNINRRMNKRGLRVIPLRYRGDIGLIYAFRPGRLSADLNHETACRLLTDRGYCCMAPNQCVMRLMARINENEEFPHEIGLFLGYPPEDVDGFINRRDEAKYSGLWKVYGNVAAAQRTFEKYRKCTSVYIKKWNEGWTMERLTLQTRRMPRSHDSSH